MESKPKICKATRKYRNKRCTRIATRGDFCPYHVPDAGSDQIVRYNFDYLTKFCKENNIVLNQSYEDCMVNRDTCIKAKCVVDGCDKDMVDKSFRNLVRNNNFGCVDHATEAMLKRVEESMIEHYGVKSPMQSEEIKLKVRNTNLEKYQTPTPAQNDQVKQKTRATNLVRYDATTPMGNPIIQQKVKNTHKERHGYENPFSDPETVEKIKATNIINHGVDHLMKLESHKKRVKETNMVKFGCEYPSQNPEVKQKIRETNIRIFGFPHPMQNGEYAANKFNRSFKHKDFVFPSGRIDKVQGDEHWALRDLLEIEKVAENDIVTCKSLVPEIFYENNGKTHRYYVDIYISSQNRCIEVKSIYTITQDPEMIALKFEATIRAGFKSEIWIYGNKHSDNMTWIFH